LVCLAPMAGVTDGIFRRICHEQGAELTCTEMISAQGLLYQPDRAANLRETFPGEGPVLLQLFGRDPEILARMAGEYGAGYAGVDLNMGCPAPKITKDGQGCALMLEPELAERIVRAASAQAAVSVKMRLGWDAGHINAVDFALRMQDAGASFLTVHGRTKEQQYSGKADWDSIAQVKASVSIPVIGNGDVFSAGDAQRMHAYTACDGVMAGRGALGNPWLFGEIQAVFHERIYTPPTLRERADMALRHAREMCLWRGERQAVPLLRKHMAWYVKGVPGGAHWRARLIGADALAEFVEIWHEFSLQDG